MRILELEEQPRTVPQSGGKVQTHAFKQDAVGSSWLVAEERESDVALVAHAHLTTEIEGQLPGPYTFHL